MNSATQNKIGSSGVAEGKSGSQSVKGAMQIVQLTGELPAMPHIAAEVIEKLSSPRALPRDIHSLLTKDQGLAARVLKVANSPYYGASRSISSLKDAILFMGFDSIKSLVLTAVMKGVLAESGLAEKLLWEHSIGCGVGSRKIAALTGLTSADEAFLAGLMHDIGKAILLLRLPKEMGAIMQEVYNSGMSFTEAEQTALGFTHAEVGKLLADKWRFSLNIEEAIANHHQPNESHSAVLLAHTVGMANVICHKLGIGPTRKPELDLSAHESAEALGLNSGQIAEIIDEVKEAVRNG